MYNVRLMVTHCVRPRPVFSLGIAIKWDNLDYGKVVQYCREVLSIASKSKRALPEICDGEVIFITVRLQILRTQFAAHTRYVCSQT
jgi:hypothetical protein